MLDLAVTVAPVAEPVSVADAKKHLRVLHSSEDDLISRLITAAYRHAEQVTGRALVTRTCELRLPAFPSTDRIVLPRPPVASVSSVTYLDDDDATQTFSASSYEVVVDAEGYGSIVLKQGASWPSTGISERAVRVTFDTGYGAASAVPKDVVAAILLHVGHLYASREAVGSAGTPVPLAYEALLDPYRTHGWI